jgi:hypothetical protein
MSEWQDMQKNSSGNFRKLLQERLDKTNPRRKLGKDETTKLIKLEGIAEKLTRGENVQNRQLQTWLSEDEFAQVDIEWKEQLELREELKDKLDDLKRYEDKLKEATFNDNKAERFRKRGNKDKSTKFRNLSESHCEDALEILQAIIC